MRRLLFGMFLVGVAATPAVAQLPLFIAGSAGAAFDVGSHNPNAGGGFAYHTAIGIRLPKVAFGGEYEQHNLGGHRKATVFGAFVRLATVTTGPVRPFFIAGLADYRYGMATGAKSHSIGGSVGPGLLIPLGGRRAGLLFEVRYHSGFERVSSFSHREFVSAGVGLELGF